jgi:aryl-alcohol dehydrogenase-like predicted oxidoreductase
MRKVQLPGFDRPVSAIGFGCASLGSRVSASKGLNALHSAFESGVDWFDLAPAYGAGEAEQIFSRFLAGRRDRVVVCSKVGRAPPRRNALIKLVYGAARPLAGALRGLRQRFRNMPSTRNVAVPLTPEFIVLSLEQSLRRLGTDHLDIFALHAPAIGDVTRDDVLLALERARTSGKVKHLAVSGDFATARAALLCPDIYSVVQVADDPLINPVGSLLNAAQRPLAVVTHSILGVGKSFDRLLQTAHAGGASALRKLSAAGYDGELETALARLLVDRALAVNADGVVLLSMFGDRHRRDNLGRAQEAPRVDAPSLVSELLSAAPAGH